MREEVILFDRHVAILGKSHFTKTKSKCLATPTAPRPASASGVFSKSVAFQQLR